MTMTSTYDHRVIQGAESGRFLALVEGGCRARTTSTRACSPHWGSSSDPRPSAPTPGARAGARGRRRPARPTSRCCRQCRRRARWCTASAATVTSRRAWTRSGAEPEGEPQLDPETAGLTPQVMAQIPARILRMYVPGETLAEALPNLRQTYCGTIAYEIEHISSHHQRVWLREQIESGAFRQPLGIEPRKALLKRLIEVDALERFMHKAYLGQHQFSIEGLDMTVPMLDELIQLAAGNGGQEVVIGMAHRGG